MSNLRIAGLRAHARRFGAYGLSLQPIDAASLVADIDALIAALQAAEGVVDWALEQTTHNPGALTIHRDIVAALKRVAS